MTESFHRKTAAGSVLQAPPKSEQSSGQRRREWARVLALSAASEQEIDGLDGPTLKGESSCASFRAVTGRSTAW
jgi:hypothetical protein